MSSRKHQLQKFKQEIQAKARQNQDHTICDHIHFVSRLTCVHLIHAVEEVIWSARDAVAAHTQAAVCALIPGVVGPAENTKITEYGLTAPHSC